MASSGQRTSTPDPLRLAVMVVNANTDMREVEPSGVDTHEGCCRLWAAGAVPSMAEGTVGV